MNTPQIISRLFVSVLFSSSCFLAQAQQGYFKVGGGYNFGIGSTIAYQSTAITTYNGNGAPTTIEDYERVNVNHGKGPQAGIAFGYMFNNNLGLELGVNYLAGSKSKLENTDTYLNNFGGQNNVSTQTALIEQKANMLLIQPSLVISSGLPGLNPYSRIGLVLAKGSLKNDYTYTYSSRGNTEITEKLYGGVGIGLQAALGVNYSLNDKAGIYVEAAFNNLSYSPNKGELTKYNSEGRDRLPDMKKAEKEVIFENEQTFNSGSNQSPSEPSTAPKERYTLNSVGLNVGLKFNL